MIHMIAICRSMRISRECAGKHPLLMGGLACTGHTDAGTYRRGTGLSTGRFSRKFSLVSLTRTLPSMRLRSGFLNFLRLSVFIATSEFVDLATQLRAVFTPLIPTICCYRASQRAQLLILIMVIGASLCLRANSVGVTPLRLACGMSSVVLAWTLATGSDTLKTWQDFWQCQRTC
jgi:hypothetical protein